MLTVNFSTASASISLYFAYAEVASRFSGIDSSNRVPDALLEPHPKAIPTHGALPAWFNEDATATAFRNLASAHTLTSLPA